MISRPVFITNNDGSCRQENVSFVFEGITPEQKTQSVKNLHNAFKEKYPNSNVLEISSKSDNPIGRKLSAFNLSITLKNGQEVPLECAFQAGKVFSKSGTQNSVLNMKPWEAKSYIRKFQKEAIIGFELDGEKFPTEPKTCFYNWLYLKALSQHPDLAKALVSYTAFTDIEFNPERSINCQAEAASVFVSLAKRGKIKDATADKESFLQIVYQEHPGNLFFVSSSILPLTPSFFEEKKIDWVLTTSGGSNYPGVKVADFSKYFNYHTLNAILNGAGELYKDLQEAFKEGLQRLNTALSKNLRVAVAIDDTSVKAFENFISNNASSYITVIGSRNSTDKECQTITNLTRRLLQIEPEAKILSGRVNGADSATIRGAGTHSLSIIPLSIRSFNGLEVSALVTKYPQFFDPKLRELTLLTHPDPESVRKIPSAMNFLSCSNYQVVFNGAENYEAKVSFCSFKPGVSRMVVFNADEDLFLGEVKGDTAQAIFLARLLDIPTYNLRNPKDIEKLKTIVANKELPLNRQFNKDNLTDGMKDMYDVILRMCRGRSRDFLKKHVIRGFFENDGPLRFEPRGGEGVQRIREPEPLPPLILELHEKGEKEIDEKEKVKAGKTTTLTAKKRTNTCRVR